MTNADCFPLTVAEADQLYHLLYVATGGLVDLHAPPSFLASQPTHRKPLVWLWRLQEAFNRASHTATLDEQSATKAPALPAGVLHSADQQAAFKRRAAEHQDQAGAALLERLAEHDREYRAKQAAGGQQQ
jgi:hypothetical protein